MSTVTAAPIPAQRGPAEAPPPGAGSRYLFFTNECVGLGHLQRTLTIADAVRAADPTGSCLVVTGSPHADLAGRQGVDTVKLPAVSRDESGRLCSPSLGLELASLFPLRAQVALAATLAYRPDVVVVDKLPAGLGGELLPTLAALRSEGRARVLLGLRDIEDAPGAVRRRWAREGTGEVVRRSYDEALVYGPPAGLDALASCPGAAPGLPVTHVGYVGAPLPAGGAEDLPEGYLLVTGGGGADGYAMAEAVVRAVRLGVPAPPVVVLAGPLMPPDRVEALRRLAHGLDVRVLGARTDARAVVVGARAVVSMAGYNTVCEVLAAGKPSLLVPRVRPSAEQLLRATRLAERGSAAVLHPDGLTPDRMRAALRDLLAVPPRVAEPRGHDGAVRAARLLVARAADVRGARR